MNNMVKKADMEELVLSEQQSFFSTVVKKLGLYGTHDFYKYFGYTLDLEKEDKNDLFDFMNKELEEFLKSNKLSNWQYYFCDNIKSAKLNNIPINAKFFLLTYRILISVYYENNIYEDDKQQYYDIYEKCKN